MSTVYAVTTVRRKADAGGDYNVSLIDLDEGVRLMSRVANRRPPRCASASGCKPVCRWRRAGRGAV
jgi:hypothetical protein